MITIQEVKSLLSSPKQVVITTHHKPDGDAMGSSLALYHFLKQKGHNVTVITPTDYPEFLEWLPGNDKVIDFTKSEAAATQLVNKAELIFCLDFNVLHRINELGDIIAKTSAKKIVIDHHLEPDAFPDFLFHDVKASSTAELIYRFIEDLGELEFLNKEVATCIYTGILTDTNSFRYSGTTPKTHQIAAELMKIGVETNRIYESIYDQFSENRLKFFGHCFLHKLNIFQEYHTALMLVTAEELKSFKIGTGDTEGLVNYALSIKNIKMSVLMVERQDMIKMSFRSKDDFSVNDLARKHFSGGGHRNAAGGKAETTLEEAASKFITVLPEYKHLLVS